MFDSIEEYNDIYIIMTSNIFDLKKKYPVLLRDKRINGFFKMNK